jgi:hypothetical protein
MELNVIAERAVYSNVASIPDSGQAKHDSTVKDSYHPTRDFPPVGVVSGLGETESYKPVQPPSTTGLQVRPSYLVPTAYLPPAAQDCTAFTALTITIPAGPRRWGRLNTIGGYSD